MNQKPKLININIDKIFTPQLSEDIPEFFKNSKLGNPIVIYKNKYILIDGYNRFMVMKLLKEKTIKCFVFEEEHDDS